MLLRKKRHARQQALERTVYSTFLERNRQSPTKLAGEQFEDLSDVILLFRKWDDAGWIELFRPAVLTASDSLYDWYRLTAKGRADLAKLYPFDKNQR